MQPQRYAHPSTYLQINVLGQRKHQELSYTPFVRFGLRVWVPCQFRIRKRARKWHIKWRYLRCHRIHAHSPIWPRRQREVPFVCCDSLGANVALGLDFDPLKVCQSFSNPSSHFRFSRLRITDFEFTQNQLVFDLLNMRLVHGWLLDEQDEATTKVVGMRPMPMLVHYVLKGPKVVFRHTNLRKSRDNQLQVCGRYCFRGSKDITFLRTPCMHAMVSRSRSDWNLMSLKRTQKLGG